MIKASPSVERRRERLQLTRDVAAGGLEGHCGAPVGFVFREFLLPLLQAGRQPRGGHQIARDERLVDLVDPDEVAVVDGEMADVLRNVVVRRGPLPTAIGEKLIDLPVLQRPVQEECGGMSGRVDDPLRPRVLPSSSTVPVLSIACG